MLVGVSGELVDQDGDPQQACLQYDRKSKKHKKHKKNRPQRPACVLHPRPADGRRTNEREPTLSGAGLALSPRCGDHEPAIQHALGPGRSLDGCPRRSALSVCWMKARTERHRVVYGDAVAGAGGAGSDAHALLLGAVHRRPRLFCSPGVSDRDQPSVWPRGRARRSAGGGLRSPKMSRRIRAPPRSCRRRQKPRALSRWLAPVGSR